MRITHSYQRQRELGASMTPMIDVVFLLLIFFVCTASFRIVESTLPTGLLAEGSSQAELPPEVLSDDLDRVLITVAYVAEEPVLQLNGAACPSRATLSEWLDQIIASDGGDLPAIVDSADAVPIGIVIDVYDRCRNSGFKQVQFAIEKR